MGFEMCRVLQVLPLPFAILAAFPSEAALLLAPPRSEEQHLWNVKFKI